MTPKPPPRAKTDTGHVTVRNTVQARLLERYGALLNWKEVGREIGVTGGMAYRVAVEGYEPRRNAIRAKLGFPVLKPTPVCACGEVHVAKKCTHRPKPPAWVSAAADWLRQHERA